MSNIGESNDEGTIAFDTKTVTTEAIDKTSTKYYLSLPFIRRNLIIMMLCWITACFNYFMLGFLLKYFPGNIYANGLMSALSESAGDLTLGLIYARIGTKATYATTLGLATVAGLGMIYYELSSGFFSGNPDEKAVWIFPALVLICKFGTSACYNVNYIANFDLFPSIFAVSALGVGDFLGSFVTIFAPEVAELQSVTPLCIFTGLSALTMLATAFLQIPRRARGSIVKPGSAIIKGENVRAGSMLSVI